MGQIANYVFGSMGGRPIGGAKQNGGKAASGLVAQREGGQAGEIAYLLARMHRTNPMRHMARMNQVNRENKCNK